MYAKKKRCLSILLNSNLELHILRMYSSDGGRTMFICFSTLRNRPNLEYLNASAEGGGGGISGRDFQQ